MNPGETKLMRRRRRNGFFKTVDDSKFRVTSVHDLSFLNKIIAVQRKPQRKKGASNNCALTQVEKQAEKQAEKRTVAKLTNKHALTEKLKFDKKSFFK